MAVAAALLSAACAENGTGESVTLTGTYSATLFRVTPTGQQAIDVLAAGGGLVITISGVGTTTGTLTIPASLNGGVALSASMAGTAIRSGDVVEFQQSADTFVRDLEWTLSASGLSVAGQTAGSASYTITLTRQGSGSPY